MTEPNYSKPLAEIPSAPAALQACRECPWRKSNLNTTNDECGVGEHKFSTDMMVAQWKETAEEGSGIMCHLTTPGYYPFDEERAEAGLKRPQLFKGESHRGCSGQLQVVRRELDKIDAHETHADYLEENPAGLTEPAARQFRSRDIRWPEESVDVMDPSELVDTKSWAWRLGRHGVVDMRNAAEVIDPKQAVCDCRLCVEHEDFHPAAEVVLSTGQSVRVDREVAGIVGAFAAAGVKTSASCADIGPLMGELDMTSYLLERDHPAGHVNYSTPIREGGAFVRFSRATTAGKAIADHLTRYYTVDAHGMVAQVTFPVAHAARVEKFIRTASARVRW